MLHCHILAFFIQSHLFKAAHYTLSAHRRASHRLTDGEDDAAIYLLLDKKNTSATMEDRVYCPGAGGRHHCFAKIARGKVLAPSVVVSAIQTPNSRGLLWVSLLVGLDVGLRFFVLPKKVALNHWLGLGFLSQGP